MKKAFIGGILAAFLVGPQPTLAQPSPPLQVERGGMGAAASTFPVRPNEQDWMAAHFINVGQASAALFEFSCGAILVDTGRQREAAVDWGQRFTDYLDRFFARRTDLNRTFDVVYITHPHPDHTSGIAALLEVGRYSFRHVITDAETTGQSIGDQRRLIRAANLRQIPQAQIRTSMIGRSVTGLTSTYIDPLRCRGREPDISVLWGTHDEPNNWPQGERIDENNHSVAVRVRFGESSFLVTGDMEETALRAMVSRYARNPRLLDVDVYVAGHHGSKNGTYDGLVQAMRPELAIISAGDPSDEESGYAAFEFGHPNLETINELTDAEFGVTMRRPRQSVAVGVSGRHPRTRAVPVYQQMDIDRAIFSTGWDGNLSFLRTRTAGKG